MEQHPTVSREEWLQARRALMVKEKELTKLRDQLSQQRRDLPWVRVDEDYVFETDAGPKTLSELFAGKSQLLVYHLMFAPEWEKACKSCSFWADHFDGIAAHLAQRDVRLIAISRAPLPKLQAFAKRMGWKFPWVSSSNNDFNYDYRVSFRAEELQTGTIQYNFGKHKAYGSDMPGISVFFRDAEGRVFHTYSVFSRGIEVVNSAYQFLDLVPKGRDEAGLPHTMAWVRLHDEY